MAHPGTVVSIGYERRTPGELVQLLHAHGVAAVIDVRELPLSRRKGFSKTPLSGLLAAAGIDYLHLRQAGNPYRSMKERTSQCLGLYRAYLGRNPTISKAVASHVNGAPVAFLCFERQHADCHRSILIDSLRHLLPHLRVITLE
jgi:uncharacterized protein (DUF488 family)